MVVEVQDLAFDHFYCIRTHFNQHSVVKMLKKATHFKTIKDDLYTGFAPQHQTHPDDKWWFTSIAVKVTTAPINEMVTKSQGSSA